jgi:hypothetical protein
VTFTGDFDTDKNIQESFIFYGEQVLKWNMNLDFIVKNVRKFNTLRFVVN